MKTQKKLFLILLMGVLVILVSNCKKDDENSKIKDGDGNVYTSIIIGTQEWLVENLKTTKFNDGITISNVTDNDEWYSLSTPGYCWYNNDKLSYKNTYGALYNWYTANSGKLCPAGWHVPTDDEWTTLLTHLGGDNVAASKLKETGIIHWESPNTEATNESGFTALPGGHRLINGMFFAVGNLGFWWSSTGNDTIGAYNLVLDHPHSDAYLDTDSPKAGFSVRCIKD